MTKAKKLNVTHEGAETEYFRFYKKSYKNLHYHHYFLYTMLHHYHIKL